MLITHSLLNNSRHACTSPIRREVHLSLRLSSHRLSHICTIHLRLLFVGQPSFLPPFPRPSQLAECQLAVCYYCYRVGRGRPIFQNCAEQHFPLLREQVTSSHRLLYSSVTDRYCQIGSSPLSDNRWIGVYMFG